MSQEVSVGTLQARLAAVQQQLLQARERAQRSDPTDVEVLDELRRLQLVYGQTQFALHLLAERMALAIQIGYAKKREGQGVYDAGQEKRVLDRIASLPHAPMESSEVTEIFNTIIQVSKNVQKRAIID